MSFIDKQRIAAVATMRALGYMFSLSDGWTAPPAGSAFISTTESDAMHSVLIRVADALSRMQRGLPEEVELARIIDAIEKYEAKRWPEAKCPAAMADLRQPFPNSGRNPHATKTYCSVPCMDGARGARGIRRSANGRVRSCIRPIVAAALAAGHDVIRGSGPNQKLALVSRVA
jgi:hypothetical protein